MISYFLDKVRDGLQLGWLKVKTIDEREIFIPYGIRVEKLSTTPKKESYRILEGIYENIIFNVSFFKENISYFSPLQNYQINNTKLLLQKTKKRLILDKKTYSIILNYSIAEGEYNLLIPDYPHIPKLIEIYKDELNGGSKFASMWFKFVSKRETTFQSKSYLHFGTYSKGCITFPYLKQEGCSKWTDISMKLAMSRIQKGISVILKVVD